MSELTHGSNFYWKYTKMEPGMSIRRNGVAQEQPFSVDVGYTSTSPTEILNQRQERVNSVEDTTLTEVITIYEKLKKGRENRVFRHSQFDGPFKRITFNEAGEAIQMTPIFNIPVEKNSISMLDFNKYHNFQHSKYVYFSEKMNLLQSEYLSALSPSFSSLLKEKNYWLNIFDPDEEDFSLLFNSYGVHDMTINDIREGNTEEKLEAFEHYTFLSLRLMRENVKELKNKNEDIDFNILLFKDFVITIHEKHWPSITDILGFLNLISVNSHTPVSPDWILFSIFTEMNQDAKYIMHFVEPEINKIRIGSKSVDIMRRNFDMELQVYSISRFIKPKKRILHQLKVKCSKRISTIVMKLLGDILTDLKEQAKDIKEFNHILERSQDTFLAIVTSDQSRQSNKVNGVIKRISEIALVLLPIQVIGGFMGTNVQVPFQSADYPNQKYFWYMCLISTLIGVTVFLFRKKILSYK